MIDFSWYKNATNEMIRRVKLGENLHDVINHLSREYTNQHGYNYSSFDFASDALGRRAWEMGLTNDHVQEEIDINYVPYNESMGNWFDSATQRMLDMIACGHHWMIVINALSREYARMHQDLYDAFDFASDALGRRAWELGLKFNEQPELSPELYSKILNQGSISYNNGKDFSSCPYQRDSMYEDIWIKGYLSNILLEDNLNDILYSNDFDTVSLKNNSIKNKKISKNFKNINEAKQWLINNEYKKINYDEITETYENDDFYLYYGWLEDDILQEAVYKGKKVKLNKPMRGDVKKFKVFVSTGKKNSDGELIAKKVNFGDKNMRIRKSNPKRRKSFAARHKCHTAKDKTTARYWSCRAPLSKAGGVW